MGIYLSSPNKEKTFDKATGKGLTAHSCEMQGWRKSMEDAKLMHISQDTDQFPTLFGVFDGHGGLEVSNIASRVFIDIFKGFFSNHKEDIKPALTSTFIEFDNYIKTPAAAALAAQVRKEKGEEAQDPPSTPQSGSTACVCAIYRGSLICANAGDSRAVLSIGGEVKQMSFDHKPQNSSERQRIQAAGGVVSFSRIDNGLNLSRALGDLMYKSNNGLPYDRQKVISVPDIVEHKLTGKESFLLIGCDGVWQNYVDNCQGMVDWVTSLIGQLGSGETVLSKMLDTCLAPKVSETGCDNMTAILVQFHS